MIRMPPSRCVVMLCASLMARSHPEREAAIDRIGLAGDPVAGAGSQEQHHVGYVGGLARAADDVVRHHLFQRLGIGIQAGLDWGRALKVVWIGGVGVAANATKLAVTWRQPMVRATARMKPAAPALAAEYTSRPDSPTRPASEMMVIRRPLLRSIMSGITAPVQLMTPYRFTSAAPLQTSGPNSQNGLRPSGDGWAPRLPALFTSTSTGPARSRTCAIMALTLTLSVTSACTA